MHLQKHESYHRDKLLNFLPAQPVCIIHLNDFITPWRSIIGMGYYFAIVDVQKLLIFIGLIFRLKRGGVI
jgi:hypothetical protein